MSSKDEFKNFVKFSTLDHFMKTHTSLCPGQFEDVWTNGCMTKKRCTKCRSVAFVDTRTLNRGVIEGYIRRDKLGLEPVEYKQDRHNYKFLNHCVSCGQWFKSHTEEDVCSACTTISSGESGLDYDQFYCDSVEFWQGGQKREVGSDGDRKSSRKVNQYKPTQAVLMLHINGWIIEGFSATEMSARLRKWLKPQSVGDHMRIDALIQSSSHRRQGAKTPTSQTVTTDKMIDAIRAMLTARIDIATIQSQVRKAIDCGTAETSDAMIRALIRKANIVITECDPSDKKWMSGAV